MSSGPVIQSKSNIQRSHIIFLCLFSHLLSRDELLSHGYLKGLLKQQVYLCFENILFKKYTTFKKHHKNAHRVMITTKYYEIYI